MYHSQEAAVRRPVWTRAIGVAVGLGIAAPLHGQHLPTGTWSGSMTLAGGPEVPLVYTVTAAGDSVHLTMNAVGGPAIPLQVTERKGDRLTISWTAGTTTTCPLKRQKNGSYRGKCSNPDGTAAELVMIPPAAAADAPDPPDRNVLTTEDLVATQATNVYDAVQRLRPQWLRARGAARVGRVAVVRVIVDSDPVGGVAYLRQMEPVAVEEVRFYTASEASMRWGGDTEGGVLHVKRRRR